MTTKELLLETSKKMNSALCRKKYKLAFDLLKLSNKMRIELGEKPLTLPNLESKFLQ